MNTRSNNRRRALVSLIAAAAVVGGIAVQAQTTAVSINWKEFAGGVNDILDGYGVVPANNWTNIQKSVSRSDILASDGSTSTVDLSGTAGGGYDTFGFAAQNNTPMRAGLVKFPGTTNNVSFTLSDLNGTFVSYDVIVYAAGFNQAAGGNIGGITVGAATKYYSVPTPYTTSLIESTDTNVGDGADLGTYVRFDGLTGDSVTVTLDAINGGVGIGGVQLVGLAVPEPSSAAIVLLGGGVLALWRRRR
jgi:hypothetical protein